MYQRLFTSDSNDVRLRALEGYLADFYRGNAEYYGEAQSEKDYIYGPLMREIQMIKSEGKETTVLEFGAGRSSFPQFMKRNRPDFPIRYIAHDIDESNADYYERLGQDFVVGGWSELEAAMDGSGLDVIFCTYVYEHLTRPGEFIEKGLSLLSKNGVMIIVCPKYTLPGYIPPALRWLGSVRGQLITLLLLAKGCVRSVVGRSRFQICVEPAVLKLPYRRDYDAVHMVWPSDLRYAVPGDFQVRRLVLARSDFVGRVVDRISTMSVVVERSQ